LIKSISLFIHTENLSKEEEDRLSQYFSAISAETEMILHILFKRGYTFKYSDGEDKVINTEEFKSILISILFPEEEKYIQVLMPTQFFRLFSKNIEENFPAESIEKEMIHYITNPKWIVPDLKYLFQSLTNRELSELLNQLQKMNLLSTYQIFLITYAFPELSVKIKRVLSKNVVKDVLELKKRAGNLKVKKRDIVGGIYSIEESIYFLMQHEVYFSYSYFLRKMQNYIRRARNIEILFLKDFRSWIDEIIQKELLYQIIAKTDDRIIARAITKNTDMYLRIFSQFISERKLNDLQSLINESTPYEEIIRARIYFILNYRRLKMQRIRSDPHSLGHLILRFTRREDYIHLLLSVGWYILSTAMKGLRKRSIIGILKNIPFAPGFLIEDVLRGVVNPNILHDEIQIQKARMICVNAIVQLYDDGIINLEE
jgi:hypothetical protein